MTITLGSGLGAQAIAKSQSTWGGTYMGTGGTTLLFKTAKLSFDPHIVQGGPYLNSGQLAALASTRVLTWTSAKVTLAGDATNTAMARQIICAMGTSSTLSEIGTGAAYGIGGTAGCAIGAVDTNNTYIDLQLGIPTDDGTVNPFSFHSGVIQKAEFMFERGALVGYTFDYLFQYVETATGLLAASPSTSPQPFSMATSTGTAGGSCFAVGTAGAEVIIPGIKKATLTIDRTLASEIDRMYLGYSYQQEPVTSDYIKVNWGLETDYNPTTKTDLFDLLLAGTAVPSVYVQSVGSAIGSSGQNNTLKFQTKSAYVESGGEPDLSGPKIVGNTINLVANIDTGNDAFLNCVYLTADSTAP